MHRHHARIGEIARYGMVGLGLVAVEYAVYLAILTLRPGAVLPAFVLARIVASVTGFVGHARFTFGNDRLSARSGLLYLLSVAGNMALAALLLVATLPLLGPLFAKMAGDAVAIGVSYLVSRNLIFPSAREDAR